MVPSSTWRVVGASVPGTSHQANEIPCQDVHTYAITPTGIVLIAVADGAGSAMRSHEGADLAVTEAVAAMHSYLANQQPEDLDQWTLMMQGVFAQVRQALLAKAADEAVNNRTFATTLMCVVLSHTTLAVGQLGDGVVVMAQDDSFCTAIQPQRGEYANETSFITQADALERVAVAVHTGDIQALAVTTDGLLRLAVQIPDYTPSPRFFRPMLNFVLETTDDHQARRELAAFLTSERVGKRTDDDKTLVLAVRMHAPMGACISAQPQEER